jgi:DNA repair photolyase
MKVREIFARTILTKTGIEGYDYCINPYVGCEHGCRYCYASFMKRFTGHPEPWGEFVDVKVNAPLVLARQVRRTGKGSVLVGTVTDPYQSVEGTYGITRACLEVLASMNFSVNVLTRSPLCVRDLDVFRRFRDLEVGLSVTTDDEEVKALFEPRSPSIKARIDALKRLRGAGIRTYAFVGPMLPLDPNVLGEKLKGTVDEVLMDRMNYPNKVAAIYRRHNLLNCLSPEYFDRTAAVLKAELEKGGIRVSLLW